MADPVAGGTRDAMDIMAIDEVSSIFPDVGRFDRSDSLRDLVNFHLLPSFFPIIVFITATC